MNIKLIRDQETKPEDAFQHSQCAAQSEECAGGQAVADVTGLEQSIPPCQNKNIK